MMASGARRDLRSYLVGLALSAALTLIAFAAVLWLDLARGTALAVVGVAAVAQIAVQLRCFLHLGFSGQKREDLQLIVFSLLMLGLMAGGTVWIMFNLAGRMHG